MSSIIVDLKIRSWTKSFTWRIIGVIILLPITYIFTGKLEDAAEITLTFHVVRMILYYFHERAWERISWGRGDNNHKKWFYISFTILILTFLGVILIQII